MLIIKTIIMKFINVIKNAYHAYGKLLSETTAFSPTGVIYFKSRKRLNK